MIDERRKYKNAHNEVGKEEYRRLHNEIGRKCKLAKEEWLKNECKRIEDNLTAGKIDSAYRKIKGTFGERKRKCMNIRNADGKPSLSKEGKPECLRAWVVLKPNNLQRTPDCFSQSTEGHRKNTFPQEIKL